MNLELATIYRFCFSLEKLTLDFFSELIISVHRIGTLIIIIIKMMAIHNLAISFQILSLVCVTIQILVKLYWAICYNPANIILMIMVMLLYLSFHDSYHIIAKVIIAHNKKLIFRVLKELTVNLFPFYDFILYSLVYY